MSRRVRGRGRSDGRKCLRSRGYAEWPSFDGLRNHGSEWRIKRAQGRGPHHTGSHPRTERGLGACTVPPLEVACAVHPAPPFRSEMPTLSGRRWWLAALAIVVVAMVAAATMLWEVSSSYWNLARDSGDLDATRERLAELSEAEREALAPDNDRNDETEDSQNSSADENLTEALNGPVPGVHESLEDLTTVLILGSDGRAAVGGNRADVILLALIPQNRNQQPVLISLPRDLWIHNRCIGGRTRINAGLNGCGDHATGPELMALMVQDFGGVTVDHYVSLDFGNFESVVDAVGGVEICVDHPLRERRHVAQFELPTGCTTLDGETALGWVRSRSTEQRVDGRWRPLPGVNDLTRNRRQRDLLLQVLEEARDGSMGERLTFAEDMLDRATVDDDLRLSTLARLAWRLRDVSMDDVVEIELPVTGHVTSGGAQVLLPEASFREVVEQHQAGLLD